MFIFRIMEVVDAIKNRYSVRGFLNKEVEKDIVKKIIQLAKMAPSGVNCQPWKIYVVLGDARDSLVAEALSRVDAGKMDKEEYAVYPSESCLLYTSPSPRDLSTSRMPSSA